MIHPHPGTLDPETTDLLGAIFLWFLIVWGSFMLAISLLLWRMDPQGRREVFRYLLLSLLILGLGIGAKMGWL